MTVCEICGGDQFTLQDGFYFCDECHTQSQDIREIVTDDMFTMGTKGMRNVQVSEQTLADRQRKREAMAEMRGVRTVISKTETMNILLQRWTAALVARGAPEQLHDVTMQLWEASLRAGGKHPTIGSISALLWLALAVCEPLCGISDLLRWARQGVVTIYSASNEMPEDVKIFWLSLLGHHKLRTALLISKEARQVVKRLRLPPPEPPPLRQLLRRLLAELMLPERLVDVVANVARRAPPLDAYLPEADALALLLVTLKMLFGLDDATEIRNSEVAAARNQAEPDGPRWFVFSEWLEFVRQQRAVASEQDFTELEASDRHLRTFSGPDLCRRSHRQLLFDFYQREGTFRCNVELPVHRGVSLFKRPDYKMQSRKLFGRLRAPPAPPPSDRDDLLRPVSSRLEREGGEALRQAESFRHSHVEFLLDESHVQSLQSEGVHVGITHAAARERAPMRSRTMTTKGVYSEAMPRDIRLVDSPNETSRPGEQLPLPDRRCPNRDLRLYMPCGDVWCVPAAWAQKRPPKIEEYERVAVTFPASFQYLMDLLASTIEFVPASFASHVARAERNVLEDFLTPPSPRSMRIGRWRARRRARKKGDEEDGKSVKRRRRKRRRVSDDESTTDCSVEMVLGSELESDAGADTAHSPELFGDEEL